MRIQSTQVWLNEAFKPAQLVIEKNKIIAIEEYNASKADRDYQDLRIIPGIIDIHNHGYNGMDSNYATKEGLINWINYLPSEGVTSYLVTTSTAPQENLLKSFELISEVIDAKPHGAQPLGIHVEGPQISHEFKGAHNPYLIQKPNIEQFELYQKAAHNKIKYICIAPENDDNHQLIKYCASKGIKVALGHTGAKFDECRSALDDGAGSFTHTFNGMLGLSHREPGTAGASLRFDDAYSEIIADGVHVHFGVVNILGRLKGKDKLILITDSVQIKGLKPGIYETPGRWVEVKEDGCGRLKDGRLAGSSNRMNVLLGNLVNKCELPLVTAINAATCNPANYMGFKNKGYLKVNYDADIVVLNDDYSVAQTYVLGEEML